MNIQWSGKVLGHHVHESLGLFPRNCLDDEASVCRRQEDCARATVCSERLAGGPGVAQFFPGLLLRYSIIIWVNRKE